jgi:hypothetical protein
MKKILFEVLVCMLLIGTVVPSINAAENWTEEQKLFPPVPTFGFGCNIALSGDTALIGAQFEDNHKGAAYVFTRTGATWIQQAKILASDGTVEDCFGNAISLYGDTALIGAKGDADHGINTGSVYVFTRNGTSWTQQAKLLASDGAEQDGFGFSVSLSGDTALIGAWHDDDKASDSGSAYVFTRTDATWMQQAKLFASNGAVNDFFGEVVSLNGDTALIGASGKDSAYVFTRTGTTWTQQQELGVGSHFSLSGDTALVTHSKYPYQSSVCVFTRTGTTWTQQTEFVASDSSLSFGCSVSLDGDTALIGDTHGLGAAYLFTRTGTTWTQKYKLLASDGYAGDDFGAYVSLDGNTALIAAYSYDRNNNSAYVFTTGGENQIPVASFTWTPSNPTINQQITFDASTSNDPDGSVAKYEWDWNNDGTYIDSKTTPTVTYSWSQAGNYPVTLRVTDSGGATSTKTMTVSVGSESENQTPDTSTKTPGFELIFVLFAIAVSILLWKKKRNK